MFSDMLIRHIFVDPNILVTHRTNLKANLRILVRLILYSYIVGIVIVYLDLMLICRLSDVHRHQPSSAL